MSILEHFNSATAKPGISFHAKNTSGFAGKLHSAINNNYHGLGTLRDNKVAVEAINSIVLKNQHLIRRGGLSKNQAEKMMHKISHEAAMKGDHLTATEHEAVKKLSHHLMKPVIRRDIIRADDDVQSHGVTSIAGLQQSKKVSQIGDQTRMASIGDTAHGSSGIASSIQHKNNPLSNLPSSGSRPTPPRIKLSI
ncbi:MAG: hypothetical protein NT034_04770 [Candidatus Magasanikbacteria bacterium]|nr:hypothetical protein [Candidatus Magasanikbacteria bacterium]